MTKKQARLMFLVVVTLNLPGCMTFTGSMGGREMLKSKTLAVSIQSSPAEVYAFVSEPRNLPFWAKTFVQSIELSKGEWIITTAQGVAKIRISAKNDFGILDHTVKLASGPEVFVPMRVVPNGGGSEVLFTLFQGPGMTDEAFAADVKMVEQDLGTLKALLEQV